MVAYPSLRLPSFLSRIFRSIAVHSPPLNFITLHYAYFIGVCLFSSLVFWGASTPARSVSYTDSLFLTVSAMTLAGLNTINLSQLNTFQQFILFLLIILGSAIWVSIAVVHVRRKAFERRFKSIVEEERQKRRTRNRSNSRRAFSISRNHSRPEVDGIVVRGSVIEPEKDLGEDVNGNVHVPSRKSELGKQPADDANGNLNVPSRRTSRSSPAVEDFAEQGSLGDGLHVGSADAESREPRASGEPLSIDTGPTRRITFASPSSPTRRREHGRLLAMQGIGARQNLLNHPLRTPPPIYDDLPKLNEGTTLTTPTSRHGVYGFMLNGFIGRNSQFSSLTLAERERLGGVEYRAVTVLSLIVPLYFVLWQLFGCIGLGWYVANNRTDATKVNAENPWWVGAFNGVSAFNNSGMSLLDANMVAFQTADYMLITMSLMILAGNTCYPIFLRFIIWTLFKLLPDNVERWHDWKVTLRFLLDHPRRCYTNLFPSRHTWWLLITLIGLNGTDWAAFEILNIGNPTVTSLPNGARTLDGLFQAFAVRSGGFYVVPIANLRIGLLILYVIMMYISVYPVVITMRNSNVYEERSLGIYADDPQSKAQEQDPANNNDDTTNNSNNKDLFHRLKRTMTHHSSHSRSAVGTTESRGYFVRQQLRGQLAHDLWWIVLAVLFITITETSQFEANPVSYSVFNVLFEVVSAYGCVGISVGLPNVAYSFCGGWHKLSKLILCAVMLRGRHRGLPVAIDRAVLLPGEHLAAAEEEDAQIRLDRSATTIAKSTV